MIGMHFVDFFACSLILVTYYGDFISRVRVRVRFRYKVISIIFVIFFLIQLIVFSRKYSTEWRHYNINKTSQFTLPCLIVGGGGGVTPVLGVFYNSL